jgi:hypothetical protein
MHHNIRTYANKVIELSYQISPTSESGFCKHYFQAATFFSLTLMSKFHSLILL